MSAGTTAGQMHCTCRHLGHHIKLAWTAVSAECRNEHVAFNAHACCLTAARCCRSCPSPGHLCLIGVDPVCAHRLSIARGCNCLLASHICGPCIHQSRHVWFRRCRPLVSAHCLEILLEDCSFRACNSQKQPCPVPQRPTPGLSPPPPCFPERLLPAGSTC